MSFIASIQFQYYFFWKGLNDSKFDNGTSIWCVYYLWYFSLKKINKFETQGARSTLIYGVFGSEWVKEDLLLLRQKWEFNCSCWSIYCKEMNASIGILCQFLLTWEIKFLKSNWFCNLVYLNFHVNVTFSLLPVSSLFSRDQGW